MTKNVWGCFAARTLVARNLQEAFHPTWLSFRTFAVSGRLPAAAHTSALLASGCPQQQAWLSLLVVIKPAVRRTLAVLRSPCLLRES